MKSSGWPMLKHLRRRGDPAEAGARPSKRTRGRMLASVKTLLKAEIAISPALGASALLAAAVGAFIVFTAFAASEFYATDEARAARASLLASMENARAPEGQARAKRVEAASESLYAAGGSETLAAAEIDRTLRRIVAGAGAAMLSSRVDVKREDLRQEERQEAHKEDRQADRKDRRIEAEIVVEGAIEAIQAALYTAETSTPFLFVEALSIHPSDAAVRGEGASGDAAKTDGADAAPLLRANVIVSAFWKGEP